MRHGSVIAARAKIEFLKGRGVRLMGSISNFIVSICSIFLCRRRLGFCLNNNSLAILFACFFASSCNLDGSSQGQLSEQEVKPSYVDLSFASECLVGLESSSLISNTKSIGPRDRAELIELLSELTVCLYEDGYEEEAETLGLEVLLLSAMNGSRPKDLRLVSDIVSDSDETLAFRAWAEWVYVSELVDHPSDLLELSAEDYQRHTEMSLFSFFVYQHYASILRGGKNE